MKTFYCIICFIIAMPVGAQREKAITTAFPFLQLTADAVASGRGDIGVCATTDAFAQHSNASKYAFAKNTSGVGVAYSPYLNHLVDDIFLGEISYYKRNSRSAWAGSLTYFTIGEVTLTNHFASETAIAGNVRPSEFTIDFSYSLKLSEHFAMGVATRYLHSSLRLPTDATSTARGVAFDISGYYTAAEHLIANSLGHCVLGFQISNIGSKIKYDDLGSAFFIPTNLKLGAAYVLSLTDEHSFSVLTEANKLLVPSENAANTDFLEGIFKSFADAPDGFKEELHEISWSIGGEYAYNESFFVRTGYFHQHKNKGDRQYFTLGTGFAYKVWQLDFSYLFSTAQTYNPLSSALKISLQYQF